MPLVITAAVLFLAPLLSAMPDEPVWSLIFAALLTGACAFQLVKSAKNQPLANTTVGIMAIDVCALLSLLYQWLIVHHGQPTYLDIMLKGTIFWLACTSAYLLSAADASKVGIYSRCIAIVAGAACAAGYGVRDYLIHLRYGEGQWREYGTSLPDFFAGHLVMTVPLTLAIFIGAKGGKGKTLWLLYLFALILQLAAIPTTGSRFALVSLPIGLLIVFATVALAVAHGMPLGSAQKIRLISLIAITLLGGVVVAKPILSRLSATTLKSQQHSGDFRVWTWRGTIRLIESSPLLGAGPGMFESAYPERAIVGYTTHAHNSYLQTAGDIGIPALLIFLITIGLAARSTIVPLAKPAPGARPEPVEINKKSKRPQRVPEPGKDPLEDFYLIDDRYLICGLVGSMAAALIQNLVDSDWFTSASGVTLFALLGLISALQPIRQRPVEIKWLRAAFAAILSISSLLAAYLTVGVVEDSVGNYVAAMRADPLSGKFASDAAIKLYMPEQDAFNTECALKDSCKLAPSAVGFHRLGQFYYELHIYSETEHSWKEGLSCDPHSVELLLNLAQLMDMQGRTGDALGYYQRITHLEMTPYGTVRAIPEVSETKFADADAAVGDSFLKQGQYASAIPLFTRAKVDCEEYSSLGGASNGMRLAMNNMVLDKDLDTHMRTLYMHVMNNLAAAYVGEGSNDKASAVRAQLTNQLKSFPGT